MSDSTSLKDDLIAMVENYGIHVVVDALLELSSGSTIGEVVQQVQRRAIRVAADIEAAETLK